MSNELFKKLQKSSPQLARAVARSSRAMELLRAIENERNTEEIEKSLKTLTESFPFLTIELSDD